jgi:hypothetical protein
MSSCVDSQFHRNEVISCDDISGDQVTRGRNDTCRGWPPSRERSSTQCTAEDEEDTEGNLRGSSRSPLPRLFRLRYSATATDGRLPLRLVS